MCRLLAFNGELGSGKDTAGERLALMTCLPVVHLSFARKLKASAAALLDIDVEDWEWMKNDPEVFITLSRMQETDAGPEERIYGALTARELLQRYGTEAHRDIFGESFWTDQAMAEYDAYVGPDTLFYVTDCRFENEALAIKQRGGTIVNVHGPNEGTSTHSSEKGLPSHLISYYIRNTEREDDFAMLDQQLRNLTQVLKIPVVIPA